MNGISIWIFEFEHWAGFYRDFGLGILHFLGYTTSLIMPSEPTNWQWFWTGAELMISAFLIQIIAFGLTAFLVIRAEMEY